MQPSPGTMSPLLRAALSLQAAYYLLTGIWPLVHLASFEAVTGPKTEDWLVRTVGALAVAIGLSLGAAAWKREATVATLVLAAAAAAAFLAVDVCYVLAGRISPIYLADALVEGALLAVLIARRR